MIKLNSKSEIQFNLERTAHLVEQWQNHWIHVGHETELKEPGDYFTIRLLTHSVIIVRNDEGKIIALNNSCRHRGSVICQTQRGSGTNLVCPYHQWTYDLKGNLKYAHSMMEEIDCNNYGLKQFELNISEGLIFIHLGEYPHSMTMPPLNQSKPLDLVAEATQYFDSEPTEQNIAFQSESTSATLLDCPKLSQRLTLVHNARFFEHDDWSVLLSFFPESNNKLRLVAKIFSKSKSLTKIRVEEIFASIEMDTHSILYFGLQSENTSLPKHATVGSPDYWDAAKDTLICRMVNEETHNVRTFTFQTERLSPFNYNPGQFITLELPIPGYTEPLFRTYTLSSSPSRPLSISITAKAQPESIGTQWMFDNVKPGTVLKAHGPAGHFSFFEKPAEKYLFISAGSGVTPMMSMTRWLFDSGNEVDINFISCIQTPKDVLFKEELKTMAKRNKGIQLTWICERDEQNAWTGFRGQINPLLLGAAVNDYREREVYCCGPEPFMKAVKEMLRESGFDMNNYQEEAFVSSLDESFIDDTEASETYHLTFAESSKQIECSQGETLLQAAQRASIPLASTCTIGVCGTCRVKVNKGKVWMNHHGGISQKEIDEGYVLACCSRPTSDLEIAK